MNATLFSGPIPWARGLRTIAALAALLSLVGCRQESPSQIDPDTLQGEPIQPAAAIATDPYSLSPSQEPPQASPEPTAETDVPPLLAADPAPKAPPPPTESKTIQVGDQEFLHVGFDRLSGFEIEIEIGDDQYQPSTNQVDEPTLTAQEQIPETILGLNGKPIALKGFMLPLKVVGGLVTEMLIMKDQSMCCFGVTPQIHEWVSVTMVDQGVKPIMDQPVTLFGTLKVGEMRENGYLVGIYALDGTDMAGPLDE